MPLNHESFQFRLTDGNHSVFTDWTAENICSPFSRLYFINAGQGVVNIDGEDYNFEKDHVFLMPTNSFCTYRSIGALDLYWIHFQIQNENKDDLFHQYECPKKIHIDNALDQHNIFQRIFSLPSYHSFEASTLLRTLMIPFLNEQAIRKNNPRAQRFYYILDYIDKNLGKKLDVHTLAEMACLQKNYFISLFKERYGLPPAKYINKRRIEVAQKELIASDENLEQLAFKLGFFDAFHFSKVFKSFTGRSPKNYKKEVMQHRVKKDIEKY